MSSSSSTYNNRIFIGGDSSAAALFNKLFPPPSSIRRGVHTHQDFHCYLTNIAPSGRATRKAWNVKENKESLTFRFDVPGLDKDKVKVWVKDNTFFIKTEPMKEFEEQEKPEEYGGRFDLPVGAYKMKEIKAEINNGVLKVFVPKVKTEEERKLDGGPWEVEVK